MEGPAGINRRAGHDRSVVRPLPERKLTVSAVIIMDSNPHLMEIVGATHAIGGFPHLLHSRDKQANQYGDNGNNHEQLDERKRAAASNRSSHGILTYKLKEISSHSLC